MANQESDFMDKTRNRVRKEKLEHKQTVLGTVDNLINTLQL